jgi:hypothetical protein
VIYEERPVEIPQITDVEAITQVPRGITQTSPREITQFMLQVQETRVPYPTVLQHEIPVEVPVHQPAEIIVQQAVGQVEIVEKQVPKIMTEVMERKIPVEKTFIEDRVVEVPEIQHVHVTRQIPVEKVVEVVKNVPKIVETRVVEKVVEVPQVLVKEVAVEVPKVMTHEVWRQEANMEVEQKLVTNSREYQRNIAREAAVAGYGEAQMGGEYHARIREVKDVREAHDREISVSVGYAGMATRDLGGVVEEQFVQPTAVVPISMEEQTDMQIAARFGGRVTGAVGTRDITYGAQMTRDIAYEPQGAMTYGTQTVTYAAPATTVVGGANMFDMLDRNHDGVITRAEFMQSMR